MQTGNPEAQVAILRVFKTCIADHPKDCIVIGEFARVLKPGGLLVFVDSLQTGDDDKLNGLLQLFPQMFHEPYYKNYLEDDIDGAFEDAGLKREYFAPAFVSRIAAFRKAV